MVVFEVGRAVEVSPGAEQTKIRKVLDELDGEVNPSDNIKGPCTLQLDTVLERLSSLLDPHDQLSLDFWSETHT